MMMAIPFATWVNGIENDISNPIQQGQQIFRQLVRIDLMDPVNEDQNVNPRLGYVRNASTMKFNAARPDQSRRPDDTRVNIISDPLRGLNPG